MSQQIQSLFDDISPTYDTLNHFLSFGIDKGWRKKAIALISADKLKALNVLDLCAGTLDCSLEFLNQYPNSTVTALDFSQKMLDYGLKKIPSALQGKIKTVCGDGMNPQFPDNNFDAIFCAYGMRNLDDNEKALKQLARILKPGGILAVLDFFRPQKLAAKVFHATYGRFWVPLMGGLISGRKGAYCYLHTSIQNFYSVEEYKKLMEKIGYNNVTMNHFLWNISSVIIGKKIKHDRTIERSHDRTPS